MSEIDSAGTAPSAERGRRAPCTHRAQQQPEWRGVPEALHPQWDVQAEPAHARARIRGRDAFVGDLARVGITIGGEADGAGRMRGRSVKDAHAAPRVARDKRVLRERLAKEGDTLVIELLKWKVRGGRREEGGGVEEGHGTWEEGRRRWTATRRWVGPPVGGGR